MLPFSSKTFLMHAKELTFDSIKSQSQSTLGYFTPKQPSFIQEKPQNICTAEVRPTYLKIGKVPAQESLFLLHYNFFF